MRLKGSTEIFTTGSPHKFYKKSSIFALEDVLFSFKLSSAFKQIILRFVM